MKTTLILTVVGATVAQVPQELTSMPACATGCLSSAFTAVGCAPTDEACQCGPSSASIGASAAFCLAESCDPAQLASAESVGSVLCSEYSAALTAGNSSSTPANIAASTTQSVTSTGFASSSVSTTTTTTETASTGLANPSASASAPTTSPSASTIGGAVGGSVGGVLVLAILGFFISRRYKGGTQPEPSPEREPAWLETRDIGGKQAVAVSSGLMPASQRVPIADRPPIYEESRAQAAKLHPPQSRPYLAGRHNPPVDRAP